MNGKAVRALAHTCKDRSILTSAGGRFSLRRASMARSVLEGGREVRERDGRGRERVQSGKAGAYVPLKTVIQDVGDIIGGTYDNLSEEKFLFVGSAKEATQ